MCAKRPLLTNTFFFMHYLSAKPRALIRKLISGVYGVCCQFWEDFTLFVAIFKMSKITRFQRKYLSFKLGSKKVRNFLQVCSCLLNIGCWWFDCGDKFLVFAKCSSTLYEIKTKYSSHLRGKM